MSRRRKTIRPTSYLRHEEGFFLPHHLDMVRAILMRGSSEKEMAEMLGIPISLMKRWKKFYPLFKAAITEGKTYADENVIVSTYQAAVGYSHEEEVLFNWQGRVIRTTRTKHHKPDMTAAKLWLTNRQKQYWKDRQQLAVSGGQNDNAPIGLREETKLEVMSSILALIKPKPDGDPAALANLEK